MTHDAPDDELIAEQIRYYDDRASVYEQLWFRQGSYSLGPEGDDRWFSETRIVEEAVDALEAEDVLELACGSGLWTRRLARRARRVVAVDASDAMLAHNRATVGASNVRFVRADLFGWETEERFDLAFAGFFVSHVPPARFADFWAKVATWLRPGGELFFVDDAWGPDRPRTSSRLPGGPDHAHRRRLAGRSYTIVKLFYRPEELAAAFDVLGWDADVRGTGAHLLYGKARPRR